MQTVKWEIDKRAEFFWVFLNKTFFHGKGLAHPGCEETREKPAGSWIQQRYQVWTSVPHNSGSQPKTTGILFSYVEQLHPSPRVQGLSLWSYQFTTPQASGLITIFKASMGQRYRFSLYDKWYNSWILENFKYFHLQQKNPFPTAGMKPFLELSQGETL